MNASPGEPGTKLIPLRQSLLNLGIMLVGDLIVTDGTVAYMGRHSKRYNNDPAKEWSEYKKRKALVVGVALIVSLISTATVVMFADQFCYTSMLSTESEWHLTACPAAPQNVTEMARVGETFRDLWEKYQ